MKNPITFLALTILMLSASLVSNHVNAQIQGQIIYKRTVELGPGDHFYYDTLKFRNNKMLYVEKHKMEQWWTEKRWRITIHPEDRQRYLDMSTLELVDQRFNFDKKRYELKKTRTVPFTWTLLDEFKTIGKYKAQKATTTTPSYNGGKLLVTAWFTTEIPIGLGPDFKWGLPGLILEMRTDGTLVGGYKLESISYTPVTVNIPNTGVPVEDEEKQSNAKLQKLMSKN